MADSDGNINVAPVVAESDRVDVRKLKIKIKLPERMMSCQDVDEHVCSLCSKGFRSKKALGGHMRIHAQHQQQLQLKADDDDQPDAVVVVDRASDIESDGEEATIRCPVCEKDFPSNKALFGHMRCHPERTWRGIQPPVNNYSSSSTVSDVNQPDDDDVLTVKKQEEEVKQVLDLEKDLLGLINWGAKAIRGRVGSAPPAAAASRLVNEDSVDGVVESLILLSRGGLEDVKDKKRKISEVLNTAEEEVMTDLTNVYSKKKMKFGECDDRRLMGSAYIDALVPNGYNAATAGAELFMQQEAAEDNKKQMHKVRKYLMVNEHLKGSISGHNLIPTHSSPVTKKLTDQRYKCTTCNKCFSSHQALGGHKSSHNKSRNNIASTRLDGEYGIHNFTAQAHDDDHQIGLFTTMASGVLQPLHQCNVCFKIFPSGQALGGHKRLHCSSSSVITQIPQQQPDVDIAESAAAAATPSICITVSAEQEVSDPSPAAPILAQTTDNIEVFRFDLNELPPPENEEQASAEQAQPADQIGSPQSTPSAQ